MKIVVILVDAQNAFGHYERGGGGGGASNNFKEFYEALKTSPNCGELEQNATKFKDAALAFQEAASDFNTAAQKVQIGDASKLGQNDIPTNFKTAAEAFGKIDTTKGGAIELVINLWHDIKTPYVDSVLGKQSQFFRAMFKGPVPLSSMAKSRGWYRFFCIPWCFVKFFWVILYIPMKVCFLCIVNFGAIVWALSWPFRLSFYAMRWPYRAIKSRMRSGSIRFPYEPSTTLSQTVTKSQPNGGILIDNQRLRPRAPYRPKNYPDASSMPDLPVDLDLLRQIWAIPVPEPRPVYVGDIPIISSPLVTKILPVLETLESIPQPTCSACCNTNDNLYT